MKTMIWMAFSLLCLPTIATAQARSHASRSAVSAVSVEKPHGDLSDPVDSLALLRDSIFGDAARRPTYRPSKVAPLSAAQLFLPLTFYKGKVLDAFSLSGGSTGEQAFVDSTLLGLYVRRPDLVRTTSARLRADRSDLDLVGLQNELIEKVAASGKPTILILVNGRPLGVHWAAENLPAIIEAWAPGMYGGQAVAEILYGKVNPSAKLAVTIPHSVGQLQMIYNHKPSQYFHPYAAGKPSKPLYPFGYGLSYTTYKYGDLKLMQKEISTDGAVDVSVKVTNVGDRDGVEIVQLYIRDKFSSVTRPVKELKDFARVPLKAGESKVVNFRITPDKLAFYDKKMKKVVEPGEFIVMVGASSSDEDLLTKTFTVR